MSATKMTNRSRSHDWFWRRYWLCSWRPRLTLPLRESRGAGTPTFNLTAQTAFLNQPDGNAVYSWGYGCNWRAEPALPRQPSPTATCPTMQVPGPTLIVTEGQTVTVNLTE